ncbi:hypothetical protein ACFQ1M_14470 [Sungkyunkwania multivorans]|uniref:Uncharacterized protein n=1 Tax=Sungkyunkwania multivorans TaxID=1173618 RepID=A0ABW3D349_9FLAO
MRTNSRDRNQRILIGILAISVISLVVVSYLNHRVSNDKESFLESERRILEQDLKKMADAYDSLKINASGFSEQLSENKIRIDRLLDSVKTSESNYSLLIEYRRKLRGLRNENKRLLQLADSLSVVNKGLTRKIQEQNEVLNGRTKIVKEEPKAADISVVIDQLQVRTLRLRDGKLLANDMADKANRLLISFNLKANGFSDQEHLNNLYVQVLDPKNKVIGERQAIVRGDERLFYTKNSEIVWDDPSSAKAINLAIKDLEKGQYFVNIFHDFKLIGSTRFELR